MVENAGVILGNACMAMQIHEDLLDLPVDFRGGISNIFHEILNLHPEELNLCKTYIETSRWEHLDGIWARQIYPLPIKQPTSSWINISRSP